MKKYLFALLTFTALFSGCIKDDIIEDFVEPTIRITAVPDTIELNTTYQFEFAYFNNVGVEENVDAQWLSSDPSIIEINSSGLATALSIGSAEISITYSGGDQEVTELVNVYVGGSTVVQEIGKSGTIQTTSSYLLEGNFTISEEGENIIIDIADDYRASTALPGLYV
ncbi:MAG: Ig-like domain-containing protein, partial [Bacteroidota bacterium]